MLRYSLIVLSAFVVNQSTALVSTPTAYGIGKPGFDQYRASLPSDFNVVAEGGYHALQQRYLTEVGKANYAKCKATLPETAPIVKSGGFDNIFKLAADPKAELIKLAVENLKNTGGKGTYKDEGKIDMLVALLQSKGEGFCSVKVDGEWEEVLTRKGKTSKKRQQAIVGAKKLMRPISTFNVKNMGFRTIVTTPRGNGVLKADVKYNPVASNFDKTKDGKIVLRRISCDITRATFKYRKLPKLSLPFMKKKGGYLDFLYLDDDMRVTRGNNGGLFIHLKPEFAKKVLA